MQEYWELQNHKLIGVGGGDSEQSPKEMVRRAETFYLGHKMLDLEVETSLCPWRMNPPKIKAFTSTGNKLFSYKTEAAGHVFQYFVDKFSGWTCWTS